MPYDYLEMQEAVYEQRTIVRNGQKAWVAAKAEKDAADTTVASAANGPQNWRNLLTLLDAIGNDANVRTLLDARATVTAFPVRKIEIATKLNAALSRYDAVNAEVQVVPDDPDGLKEQLIKINEVKATVEGLLA